MAVQALIPEIRASLPADIALDVMNDRSLSIRNAVEDVQFTLLLGFALVVAVIWLFLKSGRATSFLRWRLPISLIGTFAGMYALGHSIDNVSLLALTLSVGFVVDDAIVMLENIMRHVEEGMEPRAAAFKGSAEVGFTILSMTISLIAVFIPVLFMGGVVGRMFSEFGLDISIAICCPGLSRSRSPDALRVSAEACRSSRTALLAAARVRARLRRADGGLWLGGSQGRRLPRLMLGLTLLTFLATVHDVPIDPQGFLPAGGYGSSDRCDFGAG